MKKLIPVETSEGKKVEAVLFYSLKACILTVYDDSFSLVEAYKEYDGDVVMMDYPYSITTKELIKYLTGCFEEDDLTVLERPKTENERLVDNIDK